MDWVDAQEMTAERAASPPIVPISVARIPGRRNFSRFMSPPDTQQLIS
jgi:hypothetical protein